MPQTQCAQINRCSSIDQTDLYLNHEDDKGIVFQHDAFLECLLFQKK